MAQLGPFYPGTVTQDASGNFSWSVSVADGVKQIGPPIMSGALAGPATFNNIDCTNFGFNIPASAVITGILVEINRHANQHDDVNTRFITDLTVQLIKGGTPQGNDKADTITEWDNTQYLTIPYGASNDLWAITLTPADVNASNFGLRFSAQGDDEIGTTSADVDFIRLTVFYTLPPLGITTPATSIQLMNKVICY